MVPMGGPLLDLMPTRAEQLQQTYDGLQQTGRLLVGSIDGTLLPAGVSDDIGLYLFAPPLARAAGVDPLTAASWLLIGLVIAAGLVGAAGWLLHLRTTVGKAFAVLATAALCALALLRGDVYVASVAALVAGVPWTMRLWQTRAPFARVIPAAIALGAWAGLCNLFRSHSGTTLLVLALVGTLVLLGADRRWKAALAGGLVAGLLAVSLASGLVVQARNAYLAEQPDVLVVERAGHPFWHTAYIGLGYLSNPYGISYSDTVALEEAQRHDPDVVYLSEEYESILRASYFRVAAENPVFFASTIAAKAGVMLAMLLLVAGWAVPLAVRSRKPLAEDLAFAAGTAFSALPGIVATPVIEYLTGFIAMAVLWSVVTLDHWIAHRPSTKA